MVSTVAMDLDRKPGQGQPEAGSRIEMKLLIYLGLG
jgi:hypothetical protein